MASGEVYEFEGFTLDAPERLLARNGQTIALAPKSYDLLLALVGSAGRLVTRRELLDLVWPDTFVEEGILAVHISALRKALGDDKAGPKFIQTVSGKGYRFIAAVRCLAGSKSEPVSQSAASGNTIRRAARPEVYELAGRGRLHLLAYSVFEVPKAVEAFRAAVDLDPAYAPAHAGLAMACCAQAALRVTPPAEAYAEARAAALRALAMDSSCADAQVALGAVLFFGEWNWSAAQQSLQRALQLNPNHSEAFLLYGQLLEALGRLDEGLETKLKALERDPLSPLVHLQISLSWWNQRQYDRAIEWANKSLELDPRHPHAREHLAGAYHKTGDSDRFLSENLKHAELHGASAEVLDRVKQAWTNGGVAGLLKLSLEFAAIHPQSVPAMQLAVIHGELGAIDTGFHYLDQAIASRDPGLVHLAVAPQWDCLRSDPRFQGALTRMGLAVGRAQTP